MSMYARDVREALWEVVENFRSYRMVEFENIRMNEFRIVEQSLRTKVFRMQRISKKMLCMDPTPDVLNTHNEKDRRRHTCMW
jgi:hypothetical protein